MAQLLPLDTELNIYRTSGAVLRTPHAHATLSPRTLAAHAVRVVRAVRGAAALARDPEVRRSAAAVCLGLGRRGK